MYYAKIKNNKLDGDLTDNIRGLCPEYSFPLVITKECLPDDVVQITDTQQPEFDIATQKTVLGTPYQEVSDWFVDWDIVELTEQEKTDVYNQYDSLAQSKRKKLLIDSDWTQGKDISDQKSTVWAIYRQELRDVPAQEGYPFKIVWPTEPTI